jgi:hypothetical protein
LTHLKRRDGVGEEEEEKVVNDGNTIWKQQSERFFSIPELVCEKHRTISFKDEELK